MTASATVTRYHEVIAGVAQDVLDTAGENDAAPYAAVIAICGTAYEVAAAYALERFASVGSTLNATQVVAVNDVLDSTTTITLAADDQRRLWEAATGLDITKWAMWSQYQRLIETRNHVVHTGRVDAKRQKAPTRAHAEHALATVRAFHVYLKDGMKSGGLGEWA